MRFGIKKLVNIVFTDEKLCSQIWVEFYNPTTDLK